MDLMQKNKNFLQNMCRDNGIEFTDEDTKKVLIDRLSTIDKNKESEPKAHEVNKKDVVDNNDSEPFEAFYLAKGRWYSFGVFTNKNEMIKKFKTKGSLEYKTERYGVK